MRIVATEVGAELTITIEATADRVGCRSCGVIAKTHGRRRVRVRDLASWGRSTVPVRVKRISRCDEPLCDAATVVVDRFHAVGLANRSVDDVRRHVEPSGARIVEAGTAASCMSWCDYAVPMASDVQPVSVEELVSYLSSELAEANRKSLQDGLAMLELERCTVKVNYTVSKSKEGHIDLKVAGGMREAGEVSSNSIEITFRAAGNYAFVANEIHDSGQGDTPLVGQAEPIPKEE